MPVVVVTAPPLSPVAEARALSAVAGAVAGPLQLRPADVVVTAVHAARTMVGDEEVTAWPLVVLHGSERDPAGLRAAETAARAQVAVAWSVPEDRVWSQWLIRPAG